jgi:hypothetical protein
MLFLDLTLAYVSLLGLLLKVALLLTSAASILVLKLFQAVLLVHLVKAARPYRILATTLDMQHGFTKAFLDWGLALLWSRWSRARWVARTLTR